jgi:signal transduction histidine kinase
MAKADRALGATLLLSAMALTVSFVVLRKFKNGIHIYRTNIALIGLLFLYLLTKSGPTGYIALWLYVFPLAAFFVLGRVEGLLYTLVFFALVLLILLLQDFIEGIIPHEIAFKTRFVISLFLVGALSYCFEAVRYGFELGVIDRQVRLEEEKKKLSEAKKEAESGSRAKSEFLANMSHELRTPLNHILGFTELVLDKNFGDLNEVQEEYLGDVHHSSKHLLSLINDILDLSKIEAGKLELQPSHVNLKMLLENSLVMIKEKAMRHDIQLSMDVDGIPETIKADERKLKQIMYNLLSNAAKFTPDRGEIRVSANRINGSQFQFTGSSQYAGGDFIEISVADTGIGINHEELERIFDHFLQIENSASRRYQGTGLGLSLSKSLVELHGGKIWAESKGKDKGSVFRFIIPV